MNVALVPGPQTPRWMLADAQQVFDAAADLWELSAVLHEVADYAQRGLGTAGEALGWRGAAAEATSRRADETGARLVQVADVAQRASSAVKQFAEGLLGHGAQLRAASADRAEVVRVPIGMTDSDSQEWLTGRMGEIDARTTAQIAALEDLDAATAAALRPLPGALRELALAANSESWVTGLVPPKVAAFLAGFGVVPDAAEQRLLEAMMFAPAGAAGGDVLRRALAGWSRTGSPG